MAKNRGGRRKPADIIQGDPAWISGWGAGCLAVSGRLETAGRKPILGGENGRVGAGEGVEAEL